MRYYGCQFRMARVATGMSYRDVCFEAGISPRTLKKVEASGLIQYGTKQRGKFDQRTIDKLVDAYANNKGITFVEANGYGPGIRYQYGRFARQPDSGADQELP
jgi:hypothetical protein